MSSKLDLLPDVVDRLSYERRASILMYVRSECERRGTGSGGNVGGVRDVGKKEEGKAQFI